MQCNESPIFQEYKHKQSEFLQAIQDSWRERSRFDEALVFSDRDEIHNQVQVKQMLVFERFAPV
jgi:hypothetical protein